MALQNNLSNELKTEESLINPFKNMRTLSMNRRCDRTKFLAILMTFNMPLFFSPDSSLLSPSLTNKKSSDDKGKPYLSSCSAWNKIDVEPLMRILYDKIEIQHMK